MEALLFRKVVVDGVNYFQLFKDDSEFEPDSFFADYEHRDEKDFFYIDIDSDIDIPNAALLNIYTIDDDGLKIVDDYKTYNRVFQALKDKYHFVVREIKPVDKIVNSIKEKILFQDKCVKALVDQIYLNQSIVSSDLPIELKLSQKNNILFHGRKGSGKKTIIECLKKELDIPYVDVTIGIEVKDTLEAIITKLLDRSENENDASHGIVFIRDNYNELSEAIDGDVYSVIDYITSRGVIDYHGKLIDFRTLTFVVLCDDDQNEIYSKEDLEEIQNLTNCMTRIATRELTINEKLMVLFSKNGRLRHYEKFLNNYGKKLIVDTDCLLEIIDDCNELDPGMNLLNSVIDGIVKSNMINGISDVLINEDCVKLFAPILNSYNSNIDVVSSEEDKFSFEKKVAEIVEKTKKDVVGQDNALKKIVYQLINNIRWANKENVDDPKKYIQNILIRGNTGTGKTFIWETVLKYLEVPYFIADATEYTENGYVGKDVEKMLVGLYNAAGGDLEKAERGILVIDEVDKKNSKNDSSGHDMGGGFQEALYKLAEGTVFEINVGTKINEKPVYFDTSRLTVCLSGAFEGIEKIFLKRIGSGNIGFGEQARKEAKLKVAEISDVDYIEYGMQRQFMRRVKQIISLRDVDKQQLVNIMKKSNSSALLIQKIKLLDLGIELEYKEDFYDMLADKALEMKQGASGIEKTLVKVMESIGIQDINASEIKKICLSGAVINDPSKVELIPRKKQKVLKRK